ncbi:MAG: AAA family ATPase [Succinivibrionaceae bacterium]|nr:AAA family ATPase [Succinivibrionaceae bacterium]
MNIDSRNIPVGISDFDALISRNGKYIDKTSYLESLLDSSTAVHLLLKPRRFGKTLSMSMLAAFLEMNYQNPEDRSRQEKLFKGLNVYENNKPLCDRYMGRYPVISISLKDADGKTEIDAMNSLLNILFELFRKFNFLMNSQKIDSMVKSGFEERFEFCKRVNRELTKPENKETAKNVINTALAFLMSTLVEEYGRPVAVIVDEYDVPLQKAAVNGYYPEMLELIRSIMSSTLKDNTNLFKGYVTGCLRITHQSIFTGVNNFSIFGQCDEDFAGFIGLTLEETRQLFSECGLENRLQDAVDWYDGYNFADNDMLCPWSVLSFLRNALRNSNPATFEPRNYWANSSGNDILEICMKHATANTSQRLQNLLDGGTEVIAEREFTAYPDIAKNHDFDVFATMMMHTGYLTVDRNAESSGQNVSVRIPNREVLECFRLKANTVFGRSNPEWLAKSQKLLEALFAGEAESVATIIRSMLISFLSSRNTAYEGVYHAFLLGILAIATDEADADIKSNSERGDGYSDLVLCNDDKDVAAIIEFKKSDSESRSAWKELSGQALEQIDLQNYDFDLRKDYSIVHKYGIAFHGKHCMVAHKECRNQN